jgi:hypothetical protein
MALSHRIPTTPWRAASTWQIRPRQLAPLLGGLTIFGFGEGLLVQAQWGATPWTVFAQGLSLHAGLSIGWATLLISMTVLLCWWPLRERPGFGTVANIVVIAGVLDVTVAHLPVAHAPVLKVVYIASALLLIGNGSAWYLTTGLGPGPRDGLMTSLHRRLGVSVVYVRLALEATVFIVGLALGGTGGIGTFLFAALIGYSIGWNLTLLTWLARPR